MQVRDMTGALGTLGLFALLALCAGLWHVARGVRQSKNAPPWATALDRHRPLVVLLLGAAVISLVGLGVMAVLSLLLAEP